MEHILRISRVIGASKGGGNAVLIGVGGSGKQTATKVASYLCGQKYFRININNAYNLNTFLEDLREVVDTCGKDGHTITFMLTEGDIKESSFLEYVNALLLTGEAPNLIPKDEMA